MFSNYNNDTFGKQDLAYQYYNEKYNIANGFTDRDTLGQDSPCMTPRVPGKSCTVRCPGPGSPSAILPLPSSVCTRGAQSCSTSAQLTERSLTHTESCQITWVATITKQNKNCLTLIILLTIIQKILILSYSSSRLHKKYLS